MPISLFRGGVPFINGKAHYIAIDPSPLRGLGSIAILIAAIKY